MEEFGPLHTKGNPIWSHLSGGSLVEDCMHTNFFMASLCQPRKNRSTFWPRKFLFVAKQKQLFPTVNNVVDISNQCVLKINRNYSVKFGKRKKKLIESWMKFVKFQNLKTLHSLKTYDLDENWEMKIVESGLSVQL